MPSRSLDFLLLFALTVVVSVVSGALAFRDVARWVARREVRRYLSEHPALPFPGASLDPDAGSRLSDPGLASPEIAGGVAPSSQRRLASLSSPPISSTPTPPAVPPPLWRREDPRLGPGDDAA